MGSRPSIEVAKMVIYEKLWKSSDLDQDMASYGTTLSF